MSTSDDDQREQRSTPGDGRSIAIPGYRPAASDGPRHRPPSVQRSEAAGRVRTTGPHRAVRPGARQSGRHSAVRARVSGAGASARPPVGDRSGASRRPGRSTAPPAAGDRSRASSPPEPDRPRTAPPGAARAAAKPPPSDPPDEPARAEPRGIDELQAEMARDDIRLMARQIASAPAEPRSAPSLARSGADGMQALRKWRPYLAAALLLGALIVGGLPVLSLSGDRDDHARLAAAVQQAAQVAGAGAAPGEVAGWIRERDLPALKAFYSAQRPRIIEALHGAGFEEVGSGNVTIRVDYEDATLIIGVQLDRGVDGSLMAAADLNGELVGRAPPPAGLAPAFAEQGGTLGLLLAGAGLGCAALWVVPAVARRRQGD